MGTGKLLWSRQMTANDAFTDRARGSPVKTNCPEAKGPDFDFGSSAILVDLPGGKRALIAGPEIGAGARARPGSSRVNCLPLAGARRQRQRAGRRCNGAARWMARTCVRGGIRPGFCSAAFHGTQRVEPQGRRRDVRLQRGDRESRSGIRRHRPVAWDRAGCSPAQSAAVTAIPGSGFSLARWTVICARMLLAAAVSSGTCDTAREYQTVNGVKGNGGSIDLDRARW